MSGIAIGRLMNERKEWRKDHPPGFYARPGKTPDNSMNLLFWEAGIPGKEGTDWAGGVYKVTMDFPEEYPSRPPKCKFVPPLYHPNVYLNGDICLSILEAEKGWRPALTIKHILHGFFITNNNHYNYTGIQELLTNPHPKFSAQEKAYKDFRNNRAEYNRRIREQASQNIPDST